MIQQQLFDLTLRRPMPGLSPVTVTSASAGSPENTGHTPIIEIIGPPGSGKSTLYKALTDKWTTDCNWEFQQTAGSTNWLETFVRTITGKKARDPIIIESGLDFINHHSELAEFLWTLLSDTRIYSEKEYPKRFRAAYFLFRDFCRFQSIIQRDSNKPFVVDEGLLQRSFLVNEDRELMYEAVSRYIELIPLPSTIIYLETGNTDTLLSRIRKRRKMIASHIGLGDWELYRDLQTWQYLFKLISDKLESREVEIFRLDAEETVATNAALAYDYLRSIGLEAGLSPQS